MGPMKSAFSIVSTIGILACLGSGLTPAQAADEGVNNAPQKAAARYEDINQGCSYMIPKGLEKVIPKGPEKKKGRSGKTKFSGPKGTPMLTIYSEDYPGELQEYADAYVASLKKDYPNLKVVSVGPFTTDQKTVGIKISVTNSLQGYDLAEIVYCIKGIGNQRIAAACTMLSADAAKYQADFEACGKSLVLLP